MRQFAPACVFFAAGVIWLMLGIDLHSHAGSSSPIHSQAMTVKVDRNPDLFKTEVQPLLDMYCVSCHNEDKAKAKYRIDDINGDIASGNDTVRWEKALEMIGLGDMPPSNAKRQPSKKERAKLTEWISAELKKIGRGKLEEALLHPSQGNRVDHDALFSGEHMGPASSPPRLWRLSPQAYSELLSFDGSDAALEVLSGHGFKDYASLTADEATANVMLQTTDIVASFMVGEGMLFKRKSNHGKNKSKLEIRSNNKLIAYYENDTPATVDDTEAVVAGYRAVFEREPREAEIERYLVLLRRTSEQAGHRIGIKTTLRAMMMSSEFIFRMELGMGQQLSDGRRMLSPMELAYAIGFAILDTGPDQELLKAAEQGRLATRGDVEREVRRLLAIKEDPKNRGYQMEHHWGEFRPKKARLLRFFREYFGYASAVDVFKDDTRSIGHDPRFLVRDADQLVLHAIEQDKQVLQFLLTTDKFFVSHYGQPDDYFEWRKHQLGKTGRRDLVRNKRDREAGIFNPSRHLTKHIGAYGLPDLAWNYEPVQPFKQPVPRAGILTHPAWLVAHSGNFDNDIVRRGKWITEHLLADIVPELPIGVDAQLSTDPTKTLREKFKMKVYNDECWRCHKKMNPLGYPFEMYNDFGQYRTERYYDHEGNIVGSPKELASLRGKVEREKKRGRDYELYLTTTKPVVTTGILTGTGDPQLDGEVNDAIELMARLAKSDRVRQSFVRHTFRYWMGRNETLNDSPTLIAADQAYAQSNGSFNELLVSLLTSDSFLYRK